MIMLLNSAWLAHKPSIGGHYKYTNLSYHHGQKSSQSLHSLNSSKKRKNSTFKNQEIQRLTPTNRPMEG
jgi:hypothetical protein